MTTFCTIITAGYLPFAKVLQASLHKSIPGSSLQVLVVETNSFSSTDQLVIHSLEKVAKHPVVKKIKDKYAYTNPDHLRWALKPAFIIYLLEQGFSKVIFVDPDIYFINDFSFLINELDDNALLLTPHWANTDPLENEESLFSVLKGGLFNAGFVGANRDAVAALEWWAGLCQYKTEDSKDLGLFVDQKYLDMLPVQFDGVKIIKHRGCNLASWNIDTCKREIINGKLMINKIYEPVFIHFAKETIIHILNRNDALLAPFLDEYTKALEKEGVDLLKDLDKPDRAKFSSSVYFIRHKLKLRTRFKRFLFRLAEKL